MNLYSKVEKYILDQITEEKLKPGDQIPTENDLATLFSASRPTVRQALAKLTAEGYLVRTKGKGTFVTQPKVLHESTSIISSYRKESEKHNLQLITKVLELELIRADQKIAEQLHISLGSKVIRLTRVRSVMNFNEGKPVLYSTVYVPYKKFPEMMDLDFTTVSFYEALSEKGIEVKHTSKKLEVVTPEADIGNCLKISRFEPAIFITSVGWTTSNVVAEYAESYYPAGCSQFMIEVNN